jgi:hypothetical protein
LVSPCFDALPLEREEVRVDQNGPFLTQFIQSERVSHWGRYGARSMHKTRRRKMTVDVDEGEKAEQQSGFLAQLHAIDRLARE